MLEKFHIAVPTAFNEDESLNTKMTLCHIEKLYKLGVKSVMLCGSTGEQHSLSLKEKLQLLNEISKSYLIDRMEIVFGVSSIREKDAIILAQEISKSKIKGILLGFPPYILPSQDEAISYANKVINASGKEVILYNNPRRTGFDLSAQSILKLSSNKSVIGIKEAGDYQKIYLIKDKIENFIFYAGGEVDLKNKIEAGFSALSSILGNLDPKLVNEYFTSLLERKENIILEEKIEKLKVEVFTEKPLVTLKSIMNSNKDYIGVCRKPLGN